MRTVGDSRDNSYILWCPRHHEAYGVKEFEEHALCHLCRSAATALISLCCCEISTGRNGGLLQRVCRGGIVMPKP